MLQNAPADTMRRYIAADRHAGGLERDAGVEATGDSLMDDDLLLLSSQRSAVLGTDIAANMSIPQNQEMQASAAVQSMVGI